MPMAVNTASQAAVSMVSQQELHRVDAPVEVHQQVMGLFG